MDFPSPSAAGVRSRGTIHPLRVEDLEEIDVEVELATPASARVFDDQRLLLGGVGSCPSVPGRRSRRVWDEDFLACVSGPVVAGDLIERLAGLTVPDAGGVGPLEPNSARVTRRWRSGFTAILLSTDGRAVLHITDADSSPWTGALRSH